jgi:hypothetical protein
MRRQLLAVILAGWFAIGAGLYHAPQGSVMAGIQNVVTPVVHAEAFQTCSDVFDQLSELDFEGHQIVITGGSDLGAYMYGVDVWEYWGIFDGNPFRIDCFVWMG